MVGFIILFSPCLWAQPPRSLDLSQLLEEAKISGHQFKLVKQGVQEAQYQFRQESNRMLPQLVLQSGGKHKSNPFSEDSSALALIEITHELWDPDRGPHKELMKSKFEQKKLEGHDLALDLERKISKAYYHLLYLRETLEFQEEFISRTREMARLLERRLGSGKALPSDLFAVQIFLANLRSQKSKVNFEIARVQRLIESFLPEDSGPFQIVGELAHLHLSQSQPKLLGQLEGSPSNKALALRVNQGKLLRQRKDSQMWPKIKASIKGGYFDTDDSLDSGEPQVEGQLILQWDLFPEALPSAGRRAAMMAHKSLVLNHSLQKKELQRRAKDLLGELALVEKRVDQERERTRLARSLFKSVSKEYNRGVKDSSDVAAASQTIYDAQMSDVTHRLSFISGVKDLEYLLGNKVSLSPHSD